MKHTFFTTLFLLPAIAFFAQPVITNNDLLKVGDVVITQPCATATFNPGSAGANQVWDFSQLVAEGPEDTTFYILPAGTPYAASFPSSNIVGKFGSDGYGYYQVSGDKLFFWGQADPSANIILSDPATYFKSPATYGTFVYDTIAGSVGLGALTGTVVGNSWFEGDGYGSLQTPGGQYSDVLRVKTVTVALATVPFLGTITDSIFNYSWYKVGVKSPVLEMIDDTQWANGMVFSQSRYVNFFRSITTKTDTPVGAKVAEIVAFPNPAIDQVWFAGLDTPAHLLVHNMAGQLLLDEHINPGEPVSVKQLGAGVYVCAIYSSGDLPQFVKLVVR